MDKYSSGGFSIEPMTAERLEEYVDVFINVFTKEPWNDVYESRGQVEAFFRNYMADNYFLGWALMRGGRCAGLCFGAKKPWLAGIEYWIDQFCVAEEFQRRGVGTLFLALVEKEAERLGLNGIMLATARGFPSEKFYLKNGFLRLDDTVLLVKQR